MAIWLGLVALILTFGFLVGLAVPTQSNAAPAVLLEDLSYRVDILILRDALRARVTLKQMATGHYQAEIDSEPQGTLKSLQGHRRDHYQTEMIWRDGKLMPVVYQEQSLRRGKKHLKEYRFDYARGRLELWQWKEGKGLVHKWDGPLTGPIYDPLSAFYNCRLGFLGPIIEGSAIKIAGIPYPMPEEIEVRIGGKTQEGQKAMVTIISKAFHGGRGEVHAYLDGKKVPTQAWMTIFGFGKISGELLPGSKPMKDSLLANPQAELPHPQALASVRQAAWPSGVRTTISVLKAGILPALLPVDTGAAPDKMSPE